jgi:hypothetical protein
LLSRNFFESTQLEDIKNELLGQKIYVKKDNNEDLISNKKENDTREEKFLAALLIRDEIEIPEKYDIKYFTQDNVKNILKHILKKGKVNKKDLLKESFKEFVEDAIFSFSEVDEKKELDTLYSLIKKDYYISKERELKQKIAIAEAQGNIKKSEELLDEFLKLTKEINE